MPWGLLDAGKEQFAGTHDTVAGGVSQVRVYASEKEAQEDVKERREA